MSGEDFVVAGGGVVAGEAGLRGLQRGVLVVARGEGDQGRGKTGKLYLET